MSTPATDYANLVPANVASELISAAIEESAVLRLGRTIRLPAGTTSFPVASAVPTASFVSARGGRKPASTIVWSAEKLTPEELAVVTSLPNDWIEDASFPVWNEVRPLLAQAIGLALDRAILYGTNAPATFPAGGIAGVAGPAATGATVLEAISNAMGDVEDTGLLPSGHVVGPGAGRSLRLLRDDDGRLVYIPAITEGAPGQLFNLPIFRTMAWDTSEGDLLTGDFSKLIIGIRSDIRFDLSDQGVLTDDQGVVTVNAFQDDSTLMRAYMRVGVAIGQPVNMLGSPTLPFAFASFTAGASLPAARRQVAAPAGAARATRK